MFDLFNAYKIKDPAEIQKGVILHFRDSESTYEVLEVVGNLITARCLEACIILYPQVTFRMDRVMEGGRIVPPPHG